MPLERIGVVIDGPNLFSGARTLTGSGHLDMKRLVSWIARDRTVTGVAYWTAPLVQQVNTSAYAGQRRFFALIESQIPNARVSLGVMARRGPGRWVEKGVDVGVALDLVVGAFEDKWDTGIVVSGDGDLARAGPLVRTLGKRFEVNCCANTLSAHLAAEADSVTVFAAETLQALRY